MKQFCVHHLEDKTNHPLRDLRPATTYEIQLESIKRRHHPKTNGNSLCHYFLFLFQNSLCLDTYIVSATTETLKFDTGAPPDVPANIFVIASTNTAVRIGFDAFVEHSAEIISLHVQCEPNIARLNSKEIKRCNKLSYSNILSKLFSMPDTTNQSIEQQNQIYSTPVEKSIVLEKHEAFAKQITESFQTIDVLPYSFTRTNLQSQLQYRMVSLVSDRFTDQVIFQKFVFLFLNFVSIEKFRWIEWKHQHN